VKTRCPRSGRRSQRAGQAIVEFVVGLAVVLVLVAGLLQVAALTRAQTDTMVEARRRAGEEAMDVNQPLAGPEFIRDWTDGPDGYAYSGDDTFSEGDALTFLGAVVDQAAGGADGWDRIGQAGGDNRLYGLHRALRPVSAFGLVKGSDEETVEVIPAVRELIYDKDRITVRSDVWMTWTRGIY
jgi:hypothetical protein